MNRKNFLSAIAALGAIKPTALRTAHPATPQPSERTSQPQPLLIPPYLRAGDTIGITCPAGNITAKECQPPIQLIESWGFKVKIGDTVGKKDFSFGGTDAERLA